MMRLIVRSSSSTLSIDHCRCRTINEPRRRHSRRVRLVLPDRVDSGETYPMRKEAWPKLADSTEAAFARLRGGLDCDRAPRTRIKIIRTLAQFHWLIRQLEQAPVVAFDLETDGLEEWRPGVQIVTIGF